MRLLKIFLSPLGILARLLLWPIRKQRARALLKKDGWVELKIEGQVLEFAPRPRLHPLIARAIGKEEPPRITLSRLRKFVDYFVEDPHARGIVVRLGPLGGGWASAAELRKQLARIRSAKKEVLVFVMTHAGNLETMVASAGTKIAMTPSGVVAAIGVAFPGIYLKKALDRIGVQMQVAGKGRFKSAPERFTREDRSEADREQAQPIIDALDGALIESIMDGRVLDREGAKALLERAPMPGTVAKKEGACDVIARDEDLPELIRDSEELDEAPQLMGARSYLVQKDLPEVFSRKKQRVGVVQVHGPIIDQAPPYGAVNRTAAVGKKVVDNLRAAQRDPEVGAVVLHVNSRGGSVTASDAIFSAAKRLDQEKPVIACFGDFAASGGYYVGCGARHVVAHPLTITGSIGAFSMFPTWSKLKDMLDIGHDVMKNQTNADMFNPWSEQDEVARARAQDMIEGIYTSFLEVVAEARSLSTADVEAVAQGRVWMGKDAKAERLVDGLGGMEEAIDRAVDAAEGNIEHDAFIVTARGNQPRLAPFIPLPAQTPEGLAPLFHAAQALARGPEAEVIRELLLLSATAGPLVSAHVYAPIVGR